MIADVRLNYTRTDDKPSTRTKPSSSETVKMARSRCCSITMSPSANALPCRCGSVFNRPLEEWGKLIGDVPSATAILDRFLHHSDVDQITGRSYRIGNSGKSSNSTKA